MQRMQAVVRAMAQVFLVLALGVTQVNGASIKTALVETSPTHWRMIPSGSAVFEVGPSGFVLHSSDGRRRVSLSLPGDWETRGSAPSTTRVTRIDGSGTRNLAAVDSLDLAAVGEDACFTVDVSVPGVVTLDLKSSDPRRVSGTRLAFQGIDIADCLVPTASSTPSRWRDAGGGVYYLEVTDATSISLTQSLLYGSFLGGSGLERINDMALASDGTIVVAGGCNSFDFPVTPTAFDPTQDGPFDAFVAGISPDGGSLTFATYFGGGADEEAYTLQIDTDGSMLIAGVTNSSDLPVSSGAFDPTKNGGEDSYIARLSGDGSQLLACTYVGGNGIGTDAISLLRVDENDGTVVALGRSCSTSFPTTLGAYQPVNAGSCDYTISRFSPDLSSLLASTYFGGPSNDVSTAMAILEDGSVMIAGSSHNISATMTRGAFAGAPANSVGLLALLAPDLSRLEWSSLFDGVASFLLPKDDGSIVIVGGTSSAAFPTTAGAYSDAMQGTSDDVVCAITSDGLTLLWSTFIPLVAPGGAVDAALDDQGRVYMCGFTQTGGIPYTPDAFDLTFTGIAEGYVNVFDETGSTLLYGSLLGVGGSNGNEGATAILPDGCAGAYVAGLTYSSAFPVTPDAYDPTYGGGGDAWIVRITTDNRWTDLEAHLYSAAARPRLWPSGQLCDGEPTLLAIEDGPVSGNAYLVIGAFDLSVPFKGGTLVPTPDIVVPGIPLDAQGNVSIGFAWPPGIPSAVDLYIQAWMPDGSAPVGFAASNAVRGTSP